MPKAIKLILSIVIGVPLVAFLLLFIVFSIYDANDFKPNIVEQAQAAGINLSIENDLNWSFIPLGIEINELKIEDQTNQPFASAKVILAQVDLFSIFSGQPRVEQLSIDGLTLSLVQYSEEAANWSNLIAQKEELDSADTSKTKITPDEKQTEKDASSSDSSSQLNFLIGKISLTNTEIAYRSIPADSELSLKPFNILITDIQPDAPVPVEIEFNFKDNAGNAVDSKTLSNLKFSPDFKLIELSDFQSKNKVVTSALGGKTLAIALMTNLKLDLTAEALSLSDLSIQLDESTWKGDLSVGLANQAVKLNLAGDNINVDNYLPPPAKTETKESSATDAPTADTAATGDESLLPLETLRSLNLDIALTQKALKVKGLLVEDTKIDLEAKDGVINFNKAIGSLYEGSMQLNVSVDAKTEKPNYKANKSLSNLNLGALFEALEIQGKEDLGSISGLTNAKATISSKGNSINAIKAAALADIKFDIAEGAINGLNMKALACEGFALVNKEDVSTRDWPMATPFDTIAGTAKLANQVTTLDFDIVTSGLTIESGGDFNIDTMFMDLGAGLRVTGDLGENACRVHEKVKGLIIPVKCEGALSTPPAELCGLDSKRLLRSVEDLAKSEAKRKAKKEIDRALEKHLGGDEGEGNSAKDAAKNLLKKLF